MKITVPILPESVQDAQISAWKKQQGELIKKGDIVCELETDKIMMEIEALEDGRLEIIAKEGENVVAEQVIGSIEAAELNSEKTPDAPDTTDAEDQHTSHVHNDHESDDISSSNDQLSPSQRRKKYAGIEENGDHGVFKHAVPAHAVPAHAVPGHAMPAHAVQVSVDSEATAERSYSLKPMSRIRKTIAKRLVSSQHETASLTTFNEVDMYEIIKLRSKHQDSFVEKNGIKLGFMSFFIMAVCHALREHPYLNASIRGDEILMYNYIDIGVAVSTDRGLVVPVMRDCDTMSLATIEKTLADFATKAREGLLTMDDLSGGNFSISNGGVFGSMLSTPILNAPQSAILGMHNIVKRPVVVDDAIAIRPIMYLALTYDHRLIDGRQAVEYLVTIKRLLEDPMKMVLDL